MPSSLIDVPINSINMKFDARGVRTVEDLAKFMVEKFSRFQDEINRQNRQLFDILLAALGTSAYIDLITQSQISTSVSSQTGTIAGAGAATITMSPYTFAQGIAHDKLSSSIHTFITPDAALVADPDSPSFEIINTVGGSLDYKVKWRHINV